MNNSKTETTPELTWGKVKAIINYGLWEFKGEKELQDRRLYLYGEISSLSNSELFSIDASTTSFIVEQIIEFNRMDKKLEVKERKPIRLYINSPGGDVTEGLALVSAMETSKTPVYTINVGQWSSMAFLIGIAGHKRFSLPKTSFLMHDGSLFLYGSTKKVKDRVEFENRVENQIIKPLVLEHSKMTEEEYDRLDRKEFYMLAEDALKYGFIDEIVSSLDAIF